MTQVDLDVTLGRKIAGELGVAADAPVNWAAFGAACRQALGRSPSKRVIPEISAFMPKEDAVSYPGGHCPSRAQRPHTSRTTAPSPGPVRAAAPSSSRAVVAPPRPRRVSRPTATSDRAAKAAIAARLADQGGAAARAVRAGAPRSRVGPFLRRGLYGVSWRALLVAGAILYGSAAALHVSLAVWAGLIGGGLVLGLWHRRWALARLWRWLMVAAVVAYVGPALGSSYGDVIAGAFSLATVSAWAPAWRGARS